MTLLRLAFRFGFWLGARRALRLRPLAPCVWTERDGRRERYAVTQEGFAAVLAEVDALRRREAELLALIHDEHLVEATKRRDRPLRVARA